MSCWFSLWSVVFRMQWWVPSFWWWMFRVGLIGFCWYLSYCCTTLFCLSIDSLCQNISRLSLHMSRCCLSFQLWLCFAIGFSRLVLRVILRVRCSFMSCKGFVARVALSRFICLLVYLFSGCCCFAVLIFLGWGTRWQHCWLCWECSTSMPEISISTVGKSLSVLLHQSVIFTVLELSTSTLNFVPVSLWL